MYVYTQVYWHVHASKVRRNEGSSPHGRLLMYVYYIQVYWHVQASSQKSAYSRSLLPIQWVSFDTGLVCAGKRGGQAHR